MTMRVVLDKDAIHNLREMSFRDNDSNISGHLVIGKVTTLSLMGVMHINRMGRDGFCPPPRSL